MDSDSPERHGFTIRYAEGMAVLTIHLAAKDGRPIYADDIAARMKIMDIPPVPAKRLRDIIAANDGSPVPLVEWPAGASLGARVTVTVSEDSMEARASVVPPHPGGAPVDRTMIRRALEDAGVSRGTDQDALKSLLSGYGVKSPLVIARGRMPKRGKPARTECLFVTERGKPWKEAGGGRIDLKDLHFIQNRKAGDLLARFVDAVPAEDGFDVRGGVLEAEAVEAVPRLRAGSGAIETGEGIVAEIDGNVRLENEEVTVEESVTVKNVDYSTGNIDFDGSVAVEDSVADGFTVRATGVIQVGKTVGRARLDCGRDLVLTAGMVGDGEGSCTVGGNLYAKFIESANVEVAGDLVVTEAVLHSRCETDGRMYLTEGRGEITGGLAVLAGGLDCKKIGNVYAGETRIYAGCTPADLKAFNNLAAELKTLRDEADDLDRQIDYLKSRSGTDAREIDGLEKGKTARIERLKDGAVRLREMRNALKAEDGVSITARDRIYPGAGLYFGLEEYPIGDKGLERAVLKMENGRVVMHGFVESRDAGG